jgi:hypothetical protein
MSGGFIIGGSALHIPRDPSGVTPSSNPGYGDLRLALCGMIGGIVYSAKFAEFHCPDKHLCLRCASVDLRYAAVPEETL